MNEVRVSDERGKITMADVKDGRIRARKGQRERRLASLVLRVHRCAALDQ